ncbi:hypothetical protein GY31_01495 [Lysinibacillus sphaericus]|uniref:hypothetical protein n=1 Tax=Lysinibacillus TaxID=400634 RepID=UPI00084B039E|nr:hypothetical protein [Lysinibacillus sphaericus]OEC03442.1 hypothetical protein GY31_01495 [Lysinibacillus sphaericus]
MEHTPNLGLKKPGSTDNVLITDINENMDVLDAAISELKEGTASIPDLETVDKTLAGAINEVKQESSTVKQELDTHSGNMAKHNQFVNGANKKIQVVLGWNDTLNCPTMEYVEVAE